MNLINTKNPRKITPVAIPQSNAFIVLERTVKNITNKPLQDYI